MSVSFTARLSPSTITVALEVVKEHPMTLAWSVIDPMATEKNSPTEFSESMMKDEALLERARK
jgi:hypothetical protein